MKGFAMVNRVPNRLMAVDRIVLHMQHRFVPTCPHHDLEPLKLYDQKN